MAHHEVQFSCRIVGSQGEATAVNFVQPDLDDRIVVRTYQLDAFAAHLRQGAPLSLHAGDALTTMRLIDDCYRAAGFPVRPRTVPPTTV